MLTRNKGFMCSKSGIIVLVKFSLSTTSCLYPVLMVNKAKVFRLKDFIQPPLTSSPPLMLLCCNSVSFILYDFIFHWELRAKGIVFHCIKTFFCCLSSM